MAMQKAWTAVDKADVVVSANFKTIAAFIVLVMVTFALFVEVKAHAIWKSTFETYNKHEAERHALDKLKASVIVKLHKNLVRRRGFCTWHDNAAWATYQLAKTKVGLRILEGIVSRGEKRARWRRGSRRGRWRRRRWPSTRSTRHREYGSEDDEGTGPAESEATEDGYVVDGGG